MSYHNLEIYQLAKNNSTLIHKMSLQLPKFELYETGSQIRRSSKSVRSNIVEGYGRRRYKNEEMYKKLIDQTCLLGKKLNRFITTIEAADQTSNQKQATR